MRSRRSLGPRRGQFLLELESEAESHDDSVQMNIENGIAGRVIDRKISIADRADNRVIEFIPAAAECLPIGACADIRFAKEKHLLPEV